MTTGGPLPGFNRASAHTRDPVDLSSGALTHSHTDLALPGPGVPLAFTRTYSPVSSDSGGLGSRWTHNYEMRIEELTGSAFVVYQDGGRALFRFQSGSYVAPPGNFDSLVKNGDNTFTLTTTAQIKFNFGDHQFPQIIAGIARTAEHNTFFPIVRQFSPIAR